MAVTVVMPHLGEAVTQGTILSWAKQPGEAIAEDEVLLEVSTDSDKVDTEVPSPAAGVIQEILVSEGDTVSVGTPLAVIAERAEAATAAGTATATPASDPVSAAAPQGGGSPSGESGATGAEQGTLMPDTEADAGALSEQTWVTLREAERRTGVAASKLQTWRRQHKIASRTTQGATGMQVRVPLEEVSELAAQERFGTARRGAGPKRTGPTQAAEHEAEAEPAQWAIELLAMADTRTAQLLDRLAQAERERADAERDTAIERHKRELAEAEAARLREELATATNPELSQAQPEPVAGGYMPTLYAAFRAQVERWNIGRRKRG